MVVAQDPRRRVRVSSSSARACSCSPSVRRSRARLLAEVRVSGWSSPRTRRRRVRVSSSSARACSYSPSVRRSMARLLAEVRVSGWSSPRTRRRRARVSSSSARACSCSPSLRRSIARLFAEREGVGVVVAEDAPAAGQSVLVQCAGPLVLTQCQQVDREVDARCSSIVRGRRRRAFAVQVGRPVRTVERRPGGRRGPAGSCRPPAAVGDLVDHVVEVTCLVDGFQDVRQQEPPLRPHRRVPPRPLGHARVQQADHGGRPCASPVGPRGRGAVRPARGAR